MASTTGNRRVSLPRFQAYPIRTEIIAYGHFSSKKCLPSPSIIVNKPFTTKIAVVTVVVAALVDTGSTKSVISAAFEKAIPYKEKKEKETTNLRWITACGDPIKNVKIVKMSVKLHSVDGKPVKNRFQVVKNLTIQCILGMDFITRMEFWIHTPSSRISYKNNGTTCLLIY